MADVILSEEDYNRLKALHAKAQALMKAIPYINGMGGNLTMQNIKVRELKQAVDAAAGVDFENVRQLEGVDNAIIDRKRTKSTTR